MRGSSYFMPNPELSIAVGGCTVCNAYAHTYICLFTSVVTISFKPFISSVHSRFTLIC